MAADALWRSGATGVWADVRVIRRTPDLALEFGRSAVRVETILIDVRISEIEAPAKDDTVLIDGETWRISGAPLRDRDRLIWTCEAVAA